MVTRGPRGRLVVIRTEHERHRIVFHPGRLVLLVAVRGGWLLRRARAIPGCGVRSSVSISGVAASDEDRIRLLRAARVVRIRWASGARHRGSLGQRRIVGVRMAGIVPVFVRRAGLFDHRPSSRASSCSSSSRVSAVRRRCAALAGASKRRGTLGLFELVRAHSSDRITTRWSRRRSAVEFLSGNQPPRLSASRYADTGRK